jgi:dTMP kinase
MIKKRPEEGIFITIEGPDGSGKSTQVDLLVTYLRSCGHRVAVSREPGGTPAGEGIRKILLATGEGHELAAETELFLFAAGRAQHVREKILPMLSQGYIVISSRYIDATTAYQGYGRGLDRSFVRKVNEVATGGLLPDLTIITDIETEIGLQRASAVNKETPVGEMDRIEGAGKEFHIRVRNGYLAIAKENPQRCRIVDCSVPIAEVANVIQRHIREYFLL